MKVKSIPACIISCLALFNSYASDVDVNVISSVNTIVTGSDELTLVTDIACNKSNGPSECELVESHGYEFLEGGKLSPHWGYELVGVDLMKEFLKGKDLHTTKYATTERVKLQHIRKDKLSSDFVEGGQNSNPGKNWHGTVVANIILGDQPMAVSMNSSLSAVDIFNIRDKRKLDFKILQASEGIHSKERIDYLKDLISNGVITIRSTGNDFPREEMPQMNPEVSIMVGQLSPMGIPKFSSSSGESVTILAPGKNYSTYNGEHILFGGTSGSQPLVAGCVGNATSIIPELTQDEMETLLIKSSIPSINSRDSKKLNGAGVLNCYKLIRAVTKLKEGWPKSRQQINDNELYNFELEAKLLFNEALKLENSNINCDIKKKLKTLRAAFLLNPTDREIIERVIDTYKEIGLDYNSLFYKSLLEMDRTLELELLEMGEGSEEFKGDMIRYLLSKNPRDNVALDFAQKSKNTDVVIYGSMLASGPMKEEFKKELLGLLNNEKIDGYNYDLFEEAYFDKNNYPMKDILDICSKNMPEWEQIEFSDNMISCIIFAQRDIDASYDFFKREIMREGSIFRKKLKEMYQYAYSEERVQLYSMIATDPELSEEIKEYYLSEE